MTGNRRRSRELALQALYQWQLNESAPDELLRQLADAEDYGNPDGAYLESLVRGTVRDAVALRAHLQPLLDRKVESLSPVEHSLLLMAACELANERETPYRVIINEAVELAKVYGGTDGHKYVNGVLDKLAGALRPEEVAARAKAKS